MAPPACLKQKGLASPPQGSYLYHGVALLVSIELQFVEPSGPLYEAEKSLRHRTLREPLGRTFDPDEFAFELESLHLLALDKGQVVGCVLFAPEGRGGRLYQMAVDTDYQGKGLGQALVQHLEQELTKEGYREVVLHARQTATPFYAKLGYEFCSEEYLEIGIPHRNMRKDLVDS